MVDARTFAQIAARSLEPDPAPEPEKAPKSEPRPGTIVLRLAKTFSVNAMYRSFSRGGKGGLTTIKSKAYRDWRANALGLLATQKFTPIEGPFALQIKVPKDTRCDLDNTVKPVADILREVGAIKDDSPKYMRRVEVIIGWANHTTITIKPLEDYDVDHTRREDQERDLPPAPEGA